MSSSRVQGRISQIKRNRIYSYRKAVGGKWEYQWKGGLRVEILG